MSEIWDEDPEPQTTHPQKDGRWVKIVAHIRLNATGEVRAYPMSFPLDWEEDTPSDFMWTDGNYACDCNRALFFGYATGDEMDDDDTPCGEGAYAVNLANAKTGTIFYR